MELIENSKEPKAERLSPSGRPGLSSLSGQTRSLRAIPLGVYVFLGVFVFRLFVLVRLTNSQFLLPSAGDMQFYNDWALRILRGNWTDHMAFYGLPLYAYLLAAVYWAAALTRLCQAFYRLASRPGRRSSSISWVSWFSRRLRMRSHRPAWCGREFICLLAATGWACFQPALGYSIILMPTAWLVFVFWFVVWQIVQRPQAPALPTLLLLGGVMGFTAMGVATILFFVPLLLAALFSSVGTDLPPVEWLAPG